VAVAKLNILSYVLKIAAKLHGFPDEDRSRLALLLFFRYLYSASSQVDAQLRSCATDALKELCGVKQISFQFVSQYIGFWFDTV